MNKKVYWFEWDEDCWEQTLYGPGGFKCSVRIDTPEDNNFNRNLYDVVDQLNDQHDQLVEAKQLAKTVGTFSVTSQQIKAVGKLLNFLHGGGDMFVRHMTTVLAGTIKENE